MNRSSNVVAVALLAVIGACKQKAEPVSTPAQVATKPVATESAPPTPKTMPAAGIWGIDPAKPLTLTELQAQLPDATFTRALDTHRGAARKLVQATRGDVTMTFFFETPSKPFVWFELDVGQQLCVDGTCVGDPLAKAAASHAGSTCTANHDGQGFSMTFSCGAPTGTLLVQAALPDDVRLEHPLGQATKPFPIQDLIAANATTAGFVWVAPSQTWSPSRYDEGDR